jgi:predicted lysophospholipase L1 biosynthesis ABC-type transport system permease subunit
MSFQEKRTWISAVVAVAVPLVYAVTLLARAPGGGVAQSDYVRPLLIAVGASIVLNIVASIVTSVAGRATDPKDDGRPDERDRQINRLGEYVGFYVMSIAALVPLALAMTESAYFWIANSLYLAFALSALVSAGVKIVAYRRGF